jgi:hypothetical protein
VFCRALGGPEHGRWLIESADPDARLTRRYRGNTLILETRIETADGAALLIDFMPQRGRNPTSSDWCAANGDASGCTWSSCSASTMAGRSHG